MVIDEEMLWDTSEVPNDAKPGMIPEKSRRSL